MELVLVILEKVLEAIYFSLFLIIGKNIKEKRLLFIAIMIFEYLALKCFIKFNVWFQIIYTFMSFINLKVLYREKAQITDIFLFAVASIILILLGIVCVPGAYVVNNYIIALLLNRILMFLFLYIFRNKINNTYLKYYSLWNKHHKSNKIRSLTLRNISIIFFNLMFFALNIIMIICIATYKI